MLAALLATMPVPPANVAPPLGIDIRQVSTQQRDDGKNRHTFRIRRSFQFAAEPAGFRLTVTLLSADADAPPDERSRYRIANAPLIDRPIAMHLDRTGRLLAIDDLPGVWRDWARGLTTAAAAGGDAPTAALRARLEGLTPAQQQNVIGSIAESLFAPPAERRAAPPEPIALASPPPFADLPLTGTVTAAAEGESIRVRTAASGRTNATATSDAASVAVTIDRLVDPVTGLIRAWTRREALAGRGAKRTITTTVTLDW